MERLLDSVILIDHFNDITKATEFILGLNPEKTSISVISRAEILVGFDENSIEKAKLLLDQYRLLIIDKDIADRAAEVRRLYGWKLPDAFQAALAMHHKIKLSTRNTKDFDPEKHSFIEIPYKL
ncbi:MAG: PIN domain-containing protein [Thermodesulfobacteriota bacterium]|nr:PIN domain-containing protein [Thermodesulfobacteriota bacterium]